MLVSFIQKQKLPVKLLIRSSRNRTQKLIAMLGWTDPADQEIRELAAIIMAHVVGNISLVQFPGALQSISSLLNTPDRDDPSFFQQEDQHDHDKAWGRCQLIVQGLLIIERLTIDNNNCILIWEDHDLLDKIGKPILRSKMANQDICALWLDMLKGLLTMFTYLVRRHVFYERYEKLEFIFTELQLTVITKNESYPEVQIAAIALYALFSQRYSPDFPRQPLIDILLPLFLSCTEMKEGEEIETAEAKVKVLAGSVLAMFYNQDYLIMKIVHVIDGLMQLLVIPNTTVRVIASVILENMYRSADTIRLSLMEKVVTELFRSTSQTRTRAQTVALAITVETEDYGVKEFQGDNSSYASPELEEQSNNTGVQTTLLSLLASTINYGTDCLANAIQKIAPSDGMSRFVGMLKVLVKKNSRVVTEDGLQIIKATAWLVKLMILDSEFVQEIRKHKIIEALSEASRTVSDTTTSPTKNKPAHDLEIWELLNFNIYMYS